MELMVRDGDYVSDERGDFRRAEGSEELLQRVLWKLSIPRGSFPLLPQLGSGLYRLGRARPSERQALARQYVAEALAGEGELTVTGVELGDGGTLRVYLEWHGQTLAVTVETGGT